MHLRRRPRFWFIAALLLANLALAALIPDVRTEGRRLLDSWRHLMPRPGFAIHSVVDSFGESRKYALFLPAQAPPPAGYPLILYLNGYGQNGDDAVAPLHNGLAPVVWERQH